ncbi:hypothetical protein PBRA_000313 [Plasmodiophora brassicae]|uniref:DNA repair metallo-beta-lactamase domain-containing protein n=1 Tax=Plasmodiophora brassicae TaxID=37360 RepID=A0A0G4IH48_PLABS|nr:hypothetical protein PBRA_000313 [Plasmodiophora brassicae]
MPVRDGYQGLRRFSIFVDEWAQCESGGVYFLTHFHSDHMQGLSASFNSGIIYCSHPTRSLLLARFGFDSDQVRGCNLEEWQMVPVKPDHDLCFTMFDAGHCSGSVMILLESPWIGRVLHTGDARFGNESVAETVKSYVGAAQPDALIVDCTFCSSTCSTFPSQQESIDAVFQLIDANPTATRIVFCLLPLGAEPILKAIQKRYRTRLYFDPASFELRVLTSLTFFKSICSMESSLRFHVCGRKQLSQYMATSASPDVHDKPLLIQATTMWFAQRDMCSPGHLVVSQNNLHRVLYSMHSSLAEVRAFIHMVAPRAVYASVAPFDFSNELTGEQFARSIAKVLGRDNRLRAVGQSGFFRKLALRTAADAEVPKGENFPPPRLEPDVVATTPAEPAAAAPLIDLQGKSIFIHPQIGVQNRSSVLLQIQSSGGTRAASVSDADVVVIDCRQPRACRALRHVISNVSQVSSSSRRELLVLDLNALQRSYQFPSGVSIEDLVVWSLSRLSKRKADDIVRERLASRPRPMLDFSP